jgi:hypothetical protein
MQPTFQIETRTGAPAIVIAVDAVTARRSVTRWVGNHVADMLMADTPTLILTSQPLRWQVPVVLGSSKGTVGKVGSIDVDAQTGALTTSPELAERLLAQATQLVSNKTNSH